MLVGLLRALPAQVPHTLTGNISIVPITSKVLGNTRNLRIYLPPGYGSHPEVRYPVVYMNDGQNIFDRATSGVSHEEWRADETAESGINAGILRPMILVGIDNTADRAGEYLPTRAKLGNSLAGGNAANYSKFVINEVLPYVNSHYRTLIGAKNTTIAGSSFGGIVSLYLGLHFASVFGSVIAMSPSIWWDNREILREVDGFKGQNKPRIWVDMGGDEDFGNQTEDASDLRNANDLYDHLKLKGWRPDANLWLYLDPYRTHTETSWAARLPIVFGIYFRK